MRRGGRSSTETEGKEEHELTLTSSKGALPTQTTAPLAPPASKLVTATSLAVFPVNMPNFKSTQGASTSFSFPFRDDVDVLGDEFKIRFVEVYIVNEIVRTIDIVISGNLSLALTVYGNIREGDEGAKKEKGRDIRETTP